ncbi:hypothetical protein QJS10_CPB22g00565 [Acorus calamus]|uniref:CHAD domain-containing protein n=1 Tax=Acorus calamus TaxID=4465 RepID=A0AAV9BZY8_ACOCL|nr:hypothetical protein QJS10_CPB22g00565 [Acorus calamus]
MTPFGIVFSARPDTVSSLRLARLAELRLRSALKIQSAFRGHDVRKRFRAIRSIGLEIDGVERLFWAYEELLHVFDKERLWLKERLARLLEKLESVRSLGEYHRRVGRSVVSVQEKIRSIEALRILSEMESESELESESEEEEIYDDALENENGGEEEAKGDEETLENEEWLMVESEEETKENEETAQIGEASGRLSGLWRRMRA